MSKIKSLHEKAVLARHIIHRNSFRKFDKDVTHQIARDKGADLDRAGRFNKILIERDALKKINGVISQAYHHHIHNTLPWDDAGSRLLPSENYFNYTKRQREYQEELREAVDEFVAEYPAYIEEAKQRLNGMFRESDYMSVERVRECFGLETKIRPVPNANDIRAGIDAKEAAKIKAQIEADMQAVINDAVGDLWNRLEESLTTMRDRLDQYATEDNRRFFNSWINNVRDVTKIIERLNFTEDKHLESIRAKAEKLVSSIDNSNVKDSQPMAKRIADEADSILKAMSVYTG